MATVVNPVVGMPVMAIAGLAAHAANAMKTAAKNLLNVGMDRSPMGFGLRFAKVYEMRSWCHNGPANGASKIDYSRFD